MNNEAFAGSNVPDTIDTVGEVQVGPSAEVIRARDMDAVRRLALLSRRERQVLDEVLRGQSSKEIGTLLELSPKTVDTYRSRIMQKLGVGNLVTLVRFAIRYGVVDAP
jgi:DNA-binding NarL/FixJ family response regulator